MKILAIESSCDETAAAVVENGTKIISNVVASSTEIYQKYGGIVPEIAAREQLRCILPVIVEALAPFSTVPKPDYRSVINKNIDALAVTIGPGLIGSLLIGVETAKTFSFVTGKPLIPVNHVLAHMYANFIASSQENSSRVQNEVSTRQTDGLIAFPAISLVVSGGHTELYFMESVDKLTWLGGTLDDAAGEAFDKTARLLGFGNGGGVAVQKAALNFTMHPTTYNFKLPRPMMYEDNLNFSFSGLKTAIVREWRKFDQNVMPNSSVLSLSNGFQQPQTNLNQVQVDASLINAFAYEVQESITDVLVGKTLRATDKYNARSILLSGGVSANIRLREKFSTKIKTLNSKLALHVPPINLCTDNAVYIASYAYFRGKPISWKKIEAKPDLLVEIRS